MRATLNGMQSTFRLGRFAGIDIGVNWSWLVIFGLIVWTLSQSVFPNQNPGHSDTTYLLMGAIAAIAFFASLLGHELGHAIQARREGMQIEGITLWLFGGVAKFRGLFPSAGAEFRIAIAGPARLARPRRPVPPDRPCQPPLDSRRRDLVARLHQPPPAGIQPPASAPARRRAYSAVGPLAIQGQLRTGDVPGGRHRPRVRLPPHRRGNRARLRRRHLLRRLACVHRSVPAPSGARRGEPSPGREGCSPTAASARS